MTSKMSSLLVTYLKILIRIFLKLFYRIIKCENSVSNVFPFIIVSSVQFLVLQILSIKSQVLSVTLVEISPLLIKDHPLMQSSFNTSENYRGPTPMEIGAILKKFSPLTPEECKRRIDNTTTNFVCIAVSPVTLLVLSPPSISPQKKQRPSSSIRNSSGCNQLYSNESCSSSYILSFSCLFELRFEFCPISCFFEPRFEFCLFKLRFEFCL